MFVLLQISTCLLMVLMGVFLVLRPARTIEMQKRFYEKINWRVEPISMTKELRNTRLMGVFLIVAAVLIMLYAIYEGLYRAG